MHKKIVSSKQTSAHSSFEKEHNQFFVKDKTPVYLNTNIYYVCHIEIVQEFVYLLQKIYGRRNRSECRAVSCHNADT